VSFSAARAWRPACAASVPVQVNAPASGAAAISLTAFRLSIRVGSRESGVWRLETAGRKPDSSLQSPDSSLSSRNRPYRLPHNKQPLLDTRHDDDATLEERIVAPRARVSGFVLAHRLRVEEADLDGILAVADVEDAETA